MGCRGGGTTSIAFPTTPEKPKRNNDCTGTIYFDEQASPSDKYMRSKRIRVATPPLFGDEDLEAVENIMNMCEGGYQPF